MAIGHDQNALKLKKDFCHLGKCLIYQLVFFSTEICLFQFRINMIRWGRWTEILVQGQFKRGWQESDIENCARIIVSIDGIILIKIR